MLVRVAGRGGLAVRVRGRLAACVSAGAVDGLTRRREPTVDALPADTHAAIVALLGLSWGDLSKRG